MYCKIHNQEYETACLECSLAGKPVDDLLIEVAALCNIICNSEPDTTIKGDIESRAFYIAHHPLILGKA